MLISVTRRGRSRGQQGREANMGWTDERVELLKKLWQDGLSASQIAKQLVGVTRNAVIGKVHRLGLSGRATPSKPARTTFKAPRPARPVTAAPSAPRRLAEPVSLAVAPTPLRHVDETPRTAPARAPSPPHDHCPLH